MVHSVDGHSLVAEDNRLVVGILHQVLDVHLVADMHLHLVADIHLHQAADTYLVAEIGQGLSRSAYKVGSKSFNSVFFSYLMSSFCLLKMAQRLRVQSY